MTRTILLPTCLRLIFVLSRTSRLERYQRSITLRNEKIMRKKCVRPFNDSFSIDSLPSHLHVSASVLFSCRYERTVLPLTAIPKRQMFREKSCSLPVGSRLRGERLCTRWSTRSARSTSVGRTPARKIDNASFYSSLYLYASIARDGLYSPLTSFPLSGGKKNKGGAKKVTKLRLIGLRISII